MTTDDNLKKTLPATLQTASPIDQHLELANPSECIPELAIESNDPHNTPHPNKERLIGYALLFVTMIIWGSFTLISRFSVKQIFTPWDVGAIRFSTGLLLLLPILIWRGELALLRNTQMIILASFGGVLYIGLVFLAFSFAPAAHAAIWMNGLLPFWMAFLSFVILHDKPNKHTYISLLLIAIGLVTMMLLMWHRNAYNLNIGDGIFLLAGGAWSMYTILLKKWHFTAWQTMTGVALVSAIMYLPCYILWLPKRIFLASPIHILEQVIFQGIVVMIIAMLTYLGAIKRLGIQTVGTVLALAPLLAAIAAIPLLNEPLQLEIIIGLVAVGIAAMQPWRWFQK